jgi:protoheme IX farnesyltransferase
MNGAPSIPRSAPAAMPSAGGARLILRVLGDLLVLTKYRITLVALFTGYAAIAVEGHHALDWPLVWPCLLALFGIGGSANTLNQIFESRKDALMNRTKSRRPMPTGRISVAQAWTFALLQFATAEAILLALYHSPLAALLGLATLLYYSFFYTLYLKPRHHLNIVIGGVPGAMGPLIAWAAMTDTLAAAPVAMFALIFLWTPPHVWALAIKLKDDYARAGIPMLPVVKGVDETTRQIFIYTVVMVLATLLLPVMVSVFTAGSSYYALAVVLGAVFLGWTLVLWKRRPLLPTMPLFRFSIVYIAALFVGMVVDAMARGGRP